MTIGPNTFRFDGRALQIRDAFGQRIVCWLNPEELEHLREFLCHGETEDSNRRRSFRTPVAADVGIACSIRTGDRWVAVTTHNMSLTGILVECSDEQSLSVEVDDAIQVRVAFEDSEFEGIGMVRRRDGNRLGILFPDLIHGQKVVAPQQLSNIVMEIQRRWVQSQHKAS